MEGGGDQCDQIGQFFKVLGNKVPCKSSPNIQLWKMELFTLNWCGYFLCNFCRKLGYFLLQHLVTLVVINSICVTTIAILKGFLASIIFSFLQAQKLTIWTNQSCCSHPNMKWIFMVVVRKMDWPVSKRLNMLQRLFCGFKIVRFTLICHHPIRQF